ncbi:methyltransferase domain-containing protein [Streptomyces sp. NBC_01006]|uniref:methyltransferase domain-containing protein n=1 Tax=Streptomyces sp. NBC_01006 TaxID=2903716 RepID=UPI0038691971|nr:methyltransferase domain-containing protein [Streptomyces sp. NBC_01006]
MTTQVTTSPLQGDESSERAARPFDILGKAYEETYARPPEQLAAIDWLLARLPERARVMDIGSGTGRPTADLIAAAVHRVTGYDVSATMVDLARTQVPAALFERADVRTLPETPGQWDAVTAFFPLLQMPRADLDATLARIADWLAPGGLFVFATVPFDAEDEEIQWTGQTIRCTSYPAETYGRLLRGAGLEIVDLWQLCADLVAQRRSRPQDDLTTAWIAYRHQEGVPLTDAEIASTLMEVLTTNAETLALLVTTALQHLLSGDGYLRLVRHPDETPAAIEETLRLDPPLIGWLRTTTRPLTLAGTDLPRGARLLLLMHSAGHDGARETHAHRSLDSFDSFDSFDHRRTDAPPPSPSEPASTTAPVPSTRSSSPTTPWQR